MHDAARTRTGTRLGQGRSAVVYLDCDAVGPIARKIFTGERLSKLVLYALTGSANPYTWCRPAVECAMSRRRILASLVPMWFGDRLRLPRLSNGRWNDEHRAFELQTELIRGTHVPLRSPFVEETPPEDDPLSDLVDNIMKPLHRHLIEAGFDGLAWQAGLGNPVASANFMLDAPSTPGPPWRWVWIDLESGVPALFALNPIATAQFYLPKSFKHKRPLFDDVDVPRLRDYVTDWRTEIAQSGASVAEINEHIEALETSQRAWRGLKRHQRSICYERSQHRLTKKQAKWYADRPLRWYVRLAPRTAARAVVWAGQKARGFWRRVSRIHLGHAARLTWQFASSQRARWHVARRYVWRRVRAWSDRGFIDDATASSLRRQCHHDEVSAYLTDFGVHLAIKPVVKTLEWWVFPTLWAAGLISNTTLAIALVAGGAIGRSAYTLGRIAQATLQGQQRPWIALGVGVLPVVGNVAFPAQLLYCTVHDRDELARFILSDTFARIGRAVPIWGGADTLTEHRVHRWGDVAIRVIQPPMMSRQRDRG